MKMEPVQILVKEDSSNINSLTILDILLTVLLSILTIWYVQFLCKRRKLYKYSNKVPGPFALPFIGSALHFIGNSQDALNIFMGMYKKYPGIFRLWFGTRLIYCVSEPKYMEILLQKCLEKNEWYRYVVPAIGYGLVTAPRDAWKRHRKTIMPTFNQKILDGFIDVFSEQSNILLNQMKKVAGNGEFDVFDMLSKCTLDIICETAMGVKVNAQLSEEAPVAKWIDKISQTISLRIRTLWYQFDTIFNMTSFSKQFWTFSQNLHDFSVSVVKQKRELFEDSRELNIDPDLTCYDEGTRKKAFLDFLIETGCDSNSKFSDNELTDEVNTFLVAGSDTTATMNSFLFVMLGLHKDLQQKVFQEILDVVGPKRQVEKEDLPKLKYMELFIKETLRLFPVAGFIGRCVDEDVDIGDYIVPTGTTLIFGILSAHTNGHYWPDPYKFDPNRFLPEEVAKRHPCAYLPFSYGPRNCIGIKYAMMAMKTLLATVLREIKVGTSYKNVQDITLNANIVLRPKDGFKIDLELRQL